MPCYWHWGDDEYRRTQAGQYLLQRWVSPAWQSFNYVKQVADTEELVLEGLNQAATPPFGEGARLTWLLEPIILQRCSEPLLAELQRTLAHLAPDSHLLFSTTAKPDQRLKVTKVVVSQATVTEFSLLSPWQTEAIAAMVSQQAEIHGLRLSADGVAYLVDAIGSDSRRLDRELAKLSLWHHGHQTPLTPEDMAPLVPRTTQNSLQLATALRLGNRATALHLVHELLQAQEAPLRIAATLVGQWRTWLWVKSLVVAGERDDRAIAVAAEVGNPKRIYFLRQEVQELSLETLRAGLPILCALETQLKTGANERTALMQAMIELT
jgi:DNA polymerase-3 subunit delta